jgi:glycine C-acetyltransferase
MSYTQFAEHYSKILEEIRHAGTWKVERTIVTPQRPRIEIRDGSSGTSRPILNLCANNYLGLADHPAVIDAASRALRERGFGMASVRFICGKQDIHEELEAAVSRFLGADDTILYGSCFDANGALFEALLGPEDAILTDELNHASIIDGVRLAKAKRRIYKHSDMKDLDLGLAEHGSAGVRLIVSDGVFSMHGDVARLPEICALARRYGALVVVDDSHSTGVLGKTGRGTAEHFELAGEVDVTTGTFGKALGGGAGGFAAGRRELVALLRQRSRPYLFSNSLPPVIAAGSLKALALLDEEGWRIERLRENTLYFRGAMESRGFRIAQGIHPIVPILLGDEARTVDAARRLYERGIHAVGFTYPVVPRGQARIRVQISAAHDREDLDRALDAFEAVGRELGFIS